MRSYKLRGACHLIVQVQPKRLKHGAVRSSAGNHGRSAALAGARLSVRTRVYVHASHILAARYVVLHGVPVN